MTSDKKESGAGGAAKAAPTRSKAKRKNNTFEAAKAKASDSKADDGKYNPPKYKDASGGKYVGKNMSEFFDTKDLKLRDFRNCDLSGANFRGCILQGCLFQGAIIDEDTDFAGADLRWANFHGAQWPDGGYENVKWGDEDEEGQPYNVATLFECDGITR